MKCLQLLPVLFHDSQSLPHSERKNNTIDLQRQIDFLISDR